MTFSKILKNDIGYIEYPTLKNNYVDKLTTIHGYDTGVLYYK